MAASAQSSEGPRDRLLRRGHEALTDAEVVAALLGTEGEAAALRVARRLITHYGDLVSLGRAPANELAVLAGVGRSRACTLVAGLELGRRAQAPQVERLPVRASADVYGYYAPRLAHLRIEAFHVMCLDARHRLLRDVRVVKGGLTTCSVLPREAFAPALREGATAVIFAHNHPSGDPTPSADDLALTARLKQAGLVLGVKPLDHIIIGQGRYTSLVDSGQFAAL